MQHRRGHNLHPRESAHFFKDKFPVRPNPAGPLFPVSSEEPGGFFIPLSSSSSSTMAPGAPGRPPRFLGSSFGRQRHVSTLLVSILFSLPAVFSLEQRGTDGTANAGASDGTAASSASTTTSGTAASGTAASSAGAPATAAAGGKSSGAIPGLGGFGGAGLATINEAGSNMKTGGVFNYGFPTQTAPELGPEGKPPPPNVQADTSTVAGAGIRARTGRAMIRGRSTSRSLAE